MDSLKSDNAKAETSQAVNDILRLYNIADLQTEPHHPWQNPAERRIQDVKATSNAIMDRTKTPGNLWLQCIMYVVYIMNRLAMETLNQRTPIEVAFGVTPDISCLLACLPFHWDEPVLYYKPDSSYPDSKECFGHFVGIAENVGDALTYLILTDDTQEIICRSVVRSALDLKNPNLRALAPDGGEELKHAAAEPLIVSTRCD